MINNLKNIFHSFCKKLFLANLLTLICVYAGSAANKPTYMIEIDKDEYGNEHLRVPHSLQNAELEGKQVIKVPPEKQDVPVLLMVWNNHAE